VRESTYKGVGGEEKNMEIVKILAIKDIFFNSLVFQKNFNLLFFAFS